MNRTIRRSIGVAFLSAAVTACASTQDVAVVKPLDANHNLAVHEQGIANVAVTNVPLPVTGTVAVGNLPLPVTGTVTVGNLPLDATGAVRVTAQRGTVVLVAQNVDIAANGVTPQADPYIDTTACRSFSTFVSVAGQRASSVRPQLDLSPDGVTPGFTAGGGTLNPSGTASINAQFYYLVEGTSTPIVSPFARLSAIFNQVNMPIHVDKVWLYCGP